MVSGIMAGFIWMKSLRPLPKRYARTDFGRAVLSALLFWTGVGEFLRDLKNTSIILSFPNTKWSAWILFNERVKKRSNKHSVGLTATKKTVSLHGFIFTIHTRLTILRSRSVPL